MSRLVTRSRFVAALIALLLISSTPAAEGLQPSIPTPLPASTFQPVVVTASPEVPPASTTPTPVTAQAKRPVPVTRISGIASWYASWCNCTAMRQWRGRLVRVVGPAGVVATVRIDDYGPARWTGRIIDLNPATFEAVCKNLSRGTCAVTVTLLK